MLNEYVPLGTLGTRRTERSSQEKPSEEELAERMARIREQNEKIKQRRLVCTCLPRLLFECLMAVQDVQADEDEYKKKQEFERARLAKAKKVQENVDKTREQNARRKMEKVCPRRMSAGTCPPTYQNVGPESRMGLGKILARMDQA